ncbi:MAG: glucose-1-phosphate adenylyltransferase subunit GlgD [Oscillospiraceae bacterium]|nr:glucose-1-phosphate adenylyltransferase subunit GlgD [Oscillospiraceae bacterium]
MKNTLGIVFSNMHEHMMSDLTPHRCMGSIPIGGRYRLIDFALSSLVHSGVKDVGIITKTNYQSLMDHVGNGREWDLSRKIGGLVVLPPSTHAQTGQSGRVEALNGIMDFVKSRGAEYVITTDCDTMMNTPFDDMFDAHIQSGADITVLYKKMELREEGGRDVYVFSLNTDGKINAVLANPPLFGEQNVYLNVMITSKSLLEYLVADCYSRNLFNFERDILQAGLDKYRINAYEHKGYVTQLNSLQAYYDANLDLLNPQVRRDLFPRGLPVYTKVQDDAPVRYGLSAKVHNSLFADGCLIEGEVENSVIFRGVTIKKGAKVKNSVILQGATIGENSSLDCVITDKDVIIREGRAFAGHHTYPVYISRGAVV